MNTKPISRRRPPPVFGRPHVLVADDDEDFLALLADALKAERYRVSTVRTGRELEEAVLRSLNHDDQVRVDLILTDVRMPNGTGLEALERLKGHSDLPPVVLMTAFASAATHDSAFRLAAVAVIDKPFDISDFCAVVACIIGEPHSVVAPERTKGLPR